MRFSNILLLVVATFLTSRDVASVSANVGHAALTETEWSADPANPGNEHRSLRSDDEDDFEPSPEWTKKWTAKMKRWVDENKDPLAVARYFSGNKYGINMSKEARAKYNLFTEAWGKKNPDVTTTDEVVSSTW
ncbi:hypothetical protein PHMEG_00041151 [Phytophthora megakarya]|uniref:RxLR effector protein n=1 Tax=Phytophthora megakarya TaxID=4795 RepID=A0A225UEV2_9STRA|nr:hypothetical protein PHMEG_00041151 [Phytophthora megakarya]